MTPLVNKIAELLYPLADFYRSAGADAPEIEAIDGEAMPQPYRRLLVHERDMTPTLEAYFGLETHLKKLQWHETADALFRQVLLMVDGERRRAGSCRSEHPVEFGAIKIHLNRFGDAPRRRILEGRVPLGRILHDGGIAHYSRPDGFFRFTSDPVVREAFGLRDDPTLYGRHNVLRNADHKPLAEVVEILPPL